MVECRRCGTPCLSSHRYCPACGTDLEQPSGKPGEVMAGMTIAGRFVLCELIGSGGMGKVYRADQKGVGRTVAVKIMHPHLVNDETAVARFTNEARATSQLNHPHSIGVIDFGQTETGVLYIVMEYLHGRPLDIVLRQEYPMPFGQIAYLMCQVMEAVHAAHLLNIIHRDLKPENIFLLERQGLDRVKVLDFGIAKMLDHEDRSVTTPGLVPGTPEYMSPEQARGELLDPRSDVYSLGVIFYELLTQTVPFRGKSAVATMMSHVQDAPELPSLRAPNRGIPPALEAIVLWALAKNAADRIDSALHLRDLISAWAQVAGVWPEADLRASSPDVLLDVFSQDQLSGIADEVGDDQSATNEGQGLMPTPHASTHLIGRDEVLRQLQTFTNGSGPRVLRLQAARGSGRGLLMRELARGTKTSSARVLHCRPDPGWRPPQLGAAHRVAAFCLGLESATDLGTNGEKLLSAAKRVDLASDDIPGLKELFCLPGHVAQLKPTNRRRERATAFKHLVHAAASQNPIVLLLDDIDRYDAASRELLAGLVAEPRGNLAIVATHDEEDPQAWPPEVSLMRLEPLDDVASRELLRSLFDREIGAELADQVISAAGGIPLFIEQLAFAMHHEKLPRAPEKLVDLLAARLDALDQTESEALQAVAVTNDALSHDDLCDLLGARISVLRLEALCERGLLRETPRGFTFAHDLISGVTYSSIPSEVRRELHHKIADVLRARRADVDATAYHAFLADDGPPAIDELDRAGDAATACLDEAGATHAYTQALELVRREWGRGRMSAVELDQIAVELARKLARVLCEIGDTLTAEGVLGEVLSVAAGRDVDRAGLRLDLGRIDLERGNRQRALRRLQLARVDAEHAGVDWLVGEITRELARARGLEGEVEEAGRLLHESLELGGSDTGDSPLVQAAKVCAQIGLGDRARGYLLDALQEGDGDRSPLTKLEILIQLATVHHGCSEWSEGELRLDQAIEIAARVGDRTTRAGLLIDLARVRRIGGDVEGAREHLERALHLSRAIGWWDGIRKAQQEAEMLRYAAPQAL